MNETQPVSPTPAAGAEQVEWFRTTYQRLVSELGKVIVGHQQVVEQVLATLFSGGNALLEGVPGLGKTLLIRTLGDAMELKFSRIQFTPDLMPADITGTYIIQEDPSGRKEYRFMPGPIFANLILADEINRATPKTQSAMLEAMQERAVTVHGERRELPRPLFVLATQNPIEQEGTYPLPEAQLDRFMMKILVGFPDKEELIEIINRTTTGEEPRAQKVLSAEEVLRMQALVREVPIAPHVVEYAVRLGVATHPDKSEAPGLVRRYVRYGASPRAVQAMVLAGKVRALTEGRYNVSFDDIRWAARPALRHRIILTFAAEADGVDPEQVIDELLAEISPTGG